MPRTQRIGILGGSFNPVHNDHLALADEAKQRLGLNRLLFIPNASPAYKDSVNVSYADRRYMLATALDDHRDKDFVIEDLEQDPACHHYTCETLTKLRAQYGNDTALFFIMGSDSLLYIDEWREGLRLHTLANLVCFTRRGFEHAPVKPLIQKLINEHARYDDDPSFNEHLNDPCGNILLIKKSLHELSSSRLRAEIKLQGKNSTLARQYMDAKVLSYAMQKNLYD